jgi:hypothetical protein
MLAVTGLEGALFVAPARRGATAIQFDLESLRNAGYVIPEAIRVTDHEPFT